MKRLLSLIFSVLFITNVYAQDAGLFSDKSSTFIGQLLNAGFNKGQASLIENPILGSTTTISTLTSTTSAILKVRSDANRLFTFDGSSDTALTFKFGDGTAAQTFSVLGTTADAADTQSFQYGVATAIGPTRGAYGQLFGNEYGGGVSGAYYLSTGDATGADIFLTAKDDVRFQTEAGVEAGSWDMTTKDLTVGGNVIPVGLQFPTANYESVAGAGTTVADATAMSATKHVHQLTGANGTVGWKFATSVAGQFEILLNTTAGVPKIYAASGGTCNGGAADAACTLVTGIVAHLCYSTAVNTWICS